MSILLRLGVTFMRDQLIALVCIWKVELKGSDNYQSATKIAQKQGHALQKCGIGSDIIPSPRMIGKL